MIPALPVLLALWLCLMLVVAPLPFGSVTAGWRSIVHAGSFVALLLAIGSRRGPRDPRPMLLVAGLAAGLVALGLLQSLPLPDALVGAISPRHLEATAQVRDLLGPPEAPARLSVAASRSVSAALGWAAAIAVFVAAAICGSDRRHRWWLLGAVIATAVLEIFFGAQRLFARASTIWGVEVPGATDRLRGTFVNADHLALYLLIALAVATGWCHVAFRRSRLDRRPEHRLVAVTLPALCWLVFFVGLSFTGSRAGLVAGVAMVLAQGVLLAAALRNWRVAPVGVVAGALALGVITRIGLDQGLGRLMATSSYEVSWNARPVIYGASLELWRQFPWLGTGLGTFEAAFPLVQPAEISARVWSHAHNDWLEIMVTGGVVGLLVLLSVAAALVAGLRAVLLGSSSSTSRAVALAALGALVGVGLHEALDFGLTMPANALTMAVVLGVALGSSRRYESEGTRLIEPGEKGR